MSAENWHEERNRIVELLEAIESGKVTHIDEENLRQLAPTNPKNIAVPISSRPSQACGAGRVIRCTGIRSPTGMPFSTTGGVPLVSPWGTWSRNSNSNWGAPENIGRKHRVPLIRISFHPGLT